MAVDSRMITGEKLSPAEEKLLARMAGNDGPARPAGADDVKAANVKRDQKTTSPAADTTENDSNQPQENGDRFSAQESAQDSIQRPVVAGAKKEPGSKSPVQPAATFNAVRGALPNALTPSVAQRLAPVTTQNNPVAEEQEIKRKLKDISYITLGGSEARIADNQANSEWRRDADNSRGDPSSSYSYGYDNDPYFNVYLQSEIEQNNNLMASLQRDIDENDLRQTQIKTQMETYQGEIKTLTRQREEISEERAALIKEIKDANKGMDDTAVAVESAKTALEAKISEKYPDGKQPAYGEPDPVADAEKKLQDDAYSKHRDEVHAFYKAAGHEQDFLVMEKSAKGEKMSEGAAQEAMANLQKAKLPYNPDIALVDILREKDPAHPFLETKRVAEIGVEKTWQERNDATTTFLDIQERRLDHKVQDLDKQMLSIDQQIHDLQDKNEKSARELKVLQYEKAELTKKLEEAKAYDKVLNDPATKTALADGSMTTQQLKAQAPKFIQGGRYIDTGAECVNPNSASGQKLAAQIQNSEAAAQLANTSRTGTSASDTAIKGAGTIQDDFNSVASTQPGGSPAPDLTPGPATQVIERKPVVGAPAAAGMA